ncbi:MAG: alpha/beta hydrolase [Actinomycetota bacterium]
MSRAKISDVIELEYDTFGSPSDPALLLIMGFTAQMVAWDPELCHMLADGGLHVIRFDNRDCGLSTHLDGVEVKIDDVLRAATMDEAIPWVPYTLSDMAADAVGLLDHLGIQQAHVLGASMGGMIAQTFAIAYPQRTRTLTSIMSTTGEPEYGQSTPEALEALLTPPPTDRQGYIEYSPRWQAWHSKKYCSDEISFAAAARDYDRMYYPEGGSRQLAAIYASSSRGEALQKIDVPTLVVHGTDDTLISPSGGRRTAELIPHARLLMVEDMGHDLPRPLWPEIVSAVHELTRAVAVQ